MFKRLFILILVLNASLYASADEIPEDAISGWEEMAKAVETIQAIIRIVDIDTGGIREYWCARQGELCKCEYFSQDSETPYRVDIINERSFVIVLVDGKWQLREVSDVTETLVVNDFIAILEDGFRLHSFTKLQDIKDNPNFEIVEWRDATADNKWVDLVVRLRVPELDEITARVSLDPSKRFRMREVVYEEPQSPPVHYVYEYKDDSLLGEVIPFRVRLKGQSEGWSVSEVSNKPLPEREFSIEYYGIPQLVSSSGTNWWLWIFVGSVCVMIVLVIYRGRGKQVAARYSE